MSSGDDSDSIISPSSIQIVRVPIAKHEKIILRDTARNSNLDVEVTPSAIPGSIPQIMDLFHKWYWALLVMMKFSSHFGRGAEDYGLAETPETHLARVFLELSSSDGAEDTAELRDANPTIIPPPSFEGLRFSICEDEIDLWMLILQMYRRLPSEITDNVNRTYDFTITQLCRSYELLKFRPDNSSELEECISSIPKSITHDVPPLHFKTKPGEAEEFARLGFHNEYLEFVPYSEFQDIILISDINAVESTRLPDIGLWVPDIVRANVSHIARWPSLHRFRMYPLVDRRVVREQELCSAKPFQDTSPRHVLLCKDIPSGIFRRRDFWDEYSDCVLTTHPDTKEAILVQSFDGFRYRYFLSKYGRANALRSITLLLDSPRNMSMLREQLGEEFQKDHGYSIEWIPWECFSDIAFIAKGACGRVFRANWTPLTRKDGRPRYGEDSRRRTVIPVALKALHPIPKSIANSWFDELCTTVMVNDDFGIVQLLGISKVPGGVPVPNGLETGAFVLVSKFAEVGTLREILRMMHDAFPLNLTRITRAEGIATGLDKMHSVGVVHGCELGIRKGILGPNKQGHSFAAYLPQSPPFGSEYEDLVTSCCIRSPSGRRLTMHEVVSSLEHLVHPKSIVDLWATAYMLHNEDLDELERGGSNREAAARALNAFRICAEATDDWRAWYYLAVYIRFDHVPWMVFPALEPKSQTQSRQVHEDLAKFQCVLKCLSKTLEAGNVRAVFDVVEIARGIPREVIRHLHQTDDWSKYRTSALFPKDWEEYSSAMEGW